MDVVEIRIVRCGGRTGDRGLQPTQKPKVCRHLRPVRELHDESVLWVGGHQPMDHVEHPVRHVADRLARFGVDQQRSEVVFIVRVWAQRQRIAGAEPGDALARSVDMPDSVRKEQRAYPTVCVGRWLGDHMEGVGHPRAAGAGKHLERRCFPDLEV